MNLLHSPLVNIFYLHELVKNAFYYIAHLYKLFECGDFTVFFLVVIFAVSELLRVGLHDIDVKDLFILNYVFKQTFQERFL